MENRKRILDPDSMRSIVMGGRSTFTLVSAGTQQRYTYKFCVPKEQLSNCNTDYDVIFIKLLSGSDNDADYQYLGQIFPKRTGLAYQHGKKSRVGDTAPSVQAISWFLNQLRGNGAKLDQVEFWHEGRCARCGRKLTVPESIDTGFGPDCAAMMRIPYGKMPIEDGEAEMHRIEAEGDRAQTLRDETNKMNARLCLEGK